jgi:hypothetical protein
MDKTKLTKEQLESLAVLRERWHKISEPTPEFFGNGAVLVECFYSGGGSMWIGIEPDGYRHS